MFTFDETTFYLSELYELDIKLQNTIIEAFKTQTEFNIDQDVLEHLYKEIRINKYFENLIKENKPEKIKTISKKSQV